MRRRQTNGNLYHYAGNNPVKYTDPDGQFDFPFLSPRDFFSFLFKHDSGAKAAKLYADAASGDKTAQALAKDVTVASGKEMAISVAEAGKTIAVVTLDGVESTSDIVSEVSGDISLFGFATFQPEVAVPFGELSDGASKVSIAIAGVKASITRDKKDFNHFLSKAKEYGASTVFTTVLSKSIQIGNNGAIPEFNADATAAFIDKVRTINEEKK